MTVDFSSVQRGYAICTSPRSGSNFLSQLLTSTGKLGRPLEYFNGPARRTLDHRDYPDDPESQLQAITRLGATANGVYAFKIFMNQFDQVAHLGWASRLPNLSFVYLERRDVLGQAISWARALQTGQYRSMSASTGVAVYDSAQIRQCLSMILVEQARWRGYFALNGLQPLTIFYEEMVVAPQNTVDAVRDLVGLGGELLIDPAEINLVIQRDKTTVDWRDRFLAENADPTIPTPLF